MFTRKTWNWFPFHTNAIRKILHRIEMQNPNWNSKVCLKMVNWAMQCFWNDMEWHDVTCEKMPQNEDPWHKLYSFGSPCHHNDQQDPPRHSTGDRYFLSATAGISPLLVIPWLHLPAILVVERGLSISSGQLKKNLMLPVLMVTLIAIPHISPKAKQRVPRTFWTAKMACAIEAVHPRLPPRMYLVGCSLWTSCPPATE